MSKKTIVDAVANPKTEVSLQEARQFDSEAEVGDEIGSVIEMSDLGRIAAPPSIIFQKVREAVEAAAKRILHSARRFGQRYPSRVERRNYLVDLGKTEAVLVRSRIPRETYRCGNRVKAMLLEVRRTPKDVGYLDAESSRSLCRNSSSWKFSRGARKNRGNQVHRAGAR